MPRDRPRSRLGETIYKVRTGADLEQTELAEKAGTVQPRISDLEGSPEHLERLLDTIAAIDRACGLALGTILRRAGYVSDEIDLPAAILSDPDLDEDGREFVAHAYDFARRHGHVVTGMSPSEDHRAWLKRLGRPPTQADIEARARALEGIDEPVS